jgi:uncharacterized protein
MKKFIILSITIYQKIISNIIKQMLGIRSSCRFSPTCSEYAKANISQKGVIKGGVLSVVRILKCQPFYNGN